MVGMARCAVRRGEWQAHETFSRKRFRKSSCADAAGRCSYRQPKPRRSRYWLNRSHSSVTNYLVNQKPLSRFFPGVVSLFVLVAWFVAANHCVVAGLLPTPHIAKSAHGHCGGQAGPQQPKKSGGCDEQNCCKSLSVPAPVIAKNPVEYDHVSFVTKNYLEAAPILFGKLPAALFELDTGPPDSRSFAESVLQRSLLAHAPPRLA